jgi:PAS domain S-box-containing protein
MRQDTVEPALEIKRLQRCMSDLVSVLALPAVLNNSEPRRILETFLDALVTLLELDFLYARARVASHEEPIELVTTAETDKVRNGQDEIRHALHQWLAEDTAANPPAVRRHMGGREVSILRLQFGGDLGFVVAGCQRPNFPLQTERLVMSVAANQLAIMLQQAQLLGEQRRVARELDERVALRTAELAAANQELRKEIAERERAQDELTRSEERHRVVVETANDAVISMDESGVIILANVATKRIFGYEPAELIGKPLAVLMPQAMRKLHRAGIRRYLETNERHLNWRGSELIALRADGEHFPVEVSFGEMTADGQKIFTGFIRDVSEKKRAQEALKRSEAFLAEGQHLSRTGSFSWRLTTDEITWSEQLYRIYEFEQGTPITLERIGRQIHPEDVPMLNDMIVRARAGVSDFEYTHRLLMPGDSVKYLHLIAHGRRDAEGRLEYIGAIQDVTQRRLSEEALGKARSELTKVARGMSLGVLTASIAHEVNQPLSGIITNAGTCLRMLSSDPPNIDGARETARRTIRDGNRASDVITRLRSLYSKKEPSPEPMDLNEAAREVIALLLGELQSSGVILRHEFAGNLPVVNGDRIQLQQVILNLLRNASDAMSSVDSRPKRLVVTTEHDSDHVRLMVEDSGTGFEPAIADRFFESFYTTKKEGMGIGLSVSRSIIEAHGGRLWATANDGPGATFAFSIPCQRIHQSVEML